MWTKPPGLDPQTPNQGLEPQRRRVPFKLGRGGTLGPELERRGHYAQVGAWTPKNLTGRVARWRKDHCPTAGFLLPRRTYPNLPPTAPPSWMRTNGALCRMKAPEKGEAARGDTWPERCHAIPSELPTRPTQAYDDSKICSNPHTSIFARILPTQIRRGQPVQRCEVLDLTLVVQCTLGLVVSNDG